MIKKVHTTLLMTTNHFESGLIYLEGLRKKYPLCFFTPGYEKPLKKDIFQELLALSKLADEELSISLIRSALRIYTSSLSYRAGMIKEYSHRIGLDGEIVCPVTAEERTHAKYRPLELHWKLSDSDKPLVSELKARDKEYRQKKYLAWKKKLAGGCEVKYREMSVPVKLVKRVELMIQRFEESGTIPNPWNIV